MEDIVLINPPQLDLRQPRAYIPLGLAYIGGVLEANDIGVKVLNLADETNLSNVDYPDADWYGLSCTSATLETVQSLIPHLSHRGKIVVGGPHPSVALQETADLLNVDMVVAGEAEYYLRDVLTGAVEPQRIFDAGMIRDLDQLPLPARHLFDKEDVVDRTGIHGQDEGVPATTVLTSRGCPFQCTFCCKGHSMFSFYRFRNASNVRHELDVIIEEYDVEHIRFVDDEFTLHPHRTIDLMKAMRPLDLTWVCITRADTLSDSMLYHMKQSGCVEVHIGVESGSDRVLETMNKRTDVETLARGVQMIKEAGIRVKTYLMYGFPGETEEDREKTIDFMKHVQPDKFTVSHFTPLPGSIISQFVPKGETPWFYQDYNESFEEFRRKIKEALE